jgi:F-type H+-transporting ATPase subunit c
LEILRGGRATESVGDGPPGNVGKERQMLYLFGLALATGFTVALAAFAGSLSQGRAIAAAMEATARQPEAGGRLFTLLILGLAFIESLTIYALVISFVLSGKLPAVQEVLGVLGGH